MQAAPAHGPQFLEICTALDFLAEFVFFVDVILEIFTATPTTGKPKSLKYLLLKLTWDYDCEF